MKKESKLNKIVGNKSIGKDLLVFASGILPLAAFTSALCYDYYCNPGSSFEWESKAKTYISGKKGFHYDLSASFPSNTVKFEDYYKRE